MCLRLTDTDRNAIGISGHSFRDSFDHFLAYSGNYGKDPALIALLEEAAWSMWQPAESSHKAKP